MSPARPLDEQKREFERRRGTAMPIAGALAWTVVGIGGVFLSPILEVWLLFVATGSIVLLGLRISQLTGERLLAKDRPKNAFDTLFMSTVAMSLMVYAIAIPYYEADYTSLPLTVGVLSGLMWLPLSWLIDHWVGIFHAVVRTLLVVAVWYAFPHERFVAVPAAIVGVYIVTIAVLERRWRAMPEQSRG